MTWSMPIQRSVRRVQGSGHPPHSWESTYPLAEVRDANRELERRHTRGKIVLPATDGTGRAAVRRHKFAG